jgi:hypothetical protein
MHQFPSDADLYNEALLHTAHLIFLSRVRDKPIQAPEVASAVEQILESCAGVPNDSPTAKLMVMPLYMAGLRATSLMQQEFVRNRLEKIYNGYCVTDIATNLRGLEQEWSKGYPRSSKGENMIRLDLEMTLTAIISACSGLCLCFVLVWFQREQYANTRWLKNAVCCFHASIEYPIED